MLYVARYGMPWNVSLLDAFALSKTEDPRAEKSTLLALLDFAA
jgi:hypothetical protein